jgi:hypothetical protein
MAIPGTSIIVIDMSPSTACDCAMCATFGDWRHAVPWYCGPVAEGQSEGAYRAVCPTCYAAWEQWDAAWHVAWGKP